MRSAIYQTRYDPETYGEHHAERFKTRDRYFNIHATILISFKPKHFHGYYSSSNEYIYLEQEYGNKNTIRVLLSEQVMFIGNAWPFKP